MTDDDAVWIKYDYDGESHIEKVSPQLADLLVKAQMASVTDVFVCDELTD